MDLQPLWDRIPEDLDDDARRLVLADALQSAGDPRGEFISVQCELARLGYASRPASWDWVGDALIDPEAVDQSHVRKLRTRENALLKAHEQEWVAAADPARAKAKLRFERLCAAAPTIQSLEFGIGPVGDEIAPFFALEASRQLPNARIICR